MGIRDIREKYGKNLKGRQAVNAAIRGEIVGGEDCLDSLDRCDRLVERLKGRDLAGVAEAQRALDALRDLREVMARVIADRYDLKG